MLTSVTTCICFAKSYRNDQPYRQQLDNIREREHETSNKNEIVAIFNDTDSLVLAEMMQKQPKFFDEFECEYKKKTVAPLNVLNVFILFCLLCFFFCAVRNIARLI